MAQSYDHSMARPRLMATSIRNGLLAGLYSISTELLRASTRRNWQLDVAHGKMA